MSHVNEELSAMNAALKALNRIVDPASRKLAVAWLATRVMADVAEALGEPAPIVVFGPGVRLPGGDA